MSNPIIRSLSSLSLSSQSQSVVQLARSASSRTKGKEKSAEEEMTEARRWLNEFNPETIPERISQLSSSKPSKGRVGSSGGGEVRVQLLTPLDDLLPFVPKPMHESIRNHRYYVKNSKSWIITSEKERYKKENTQACFRKLFNTLQEIGKATIPREPTALPSRKMPTVSYSEWSQMSRVEVNQNKNKIRKEHDSMHHQSLVEKARNRKEEEKQSSREASPRKGKP